MRGTTQTNLRIRPELLERLKRAAEENHRTLGAEISLRLEQSFEPHEPADVLREIAAASKVLAEAGAKLAGVQAAPTDEDPDHYYSEANRRERAQRARALAEGLVASGRVRTVPAHDFGDPNPYAKADAAARRSRTKKDKSNV